VRHVRICRRQGAGRDPYSGRWLRARGLRGNASCLISSRFRGYYARVRSYEVVRQLLTERVWCSTRASTRTVVWPRWRDWDHLRPERAGQEFSAPAMCRTVIQDRWPPVTRRRKPGRARLRREAPNATTGRTGLAFSRAMRDEPMRPMLATGSKVLWIWVCKKEVLTNL